MSERSSIVKSLHTAFTGSPLSRRQRLEKPQPKAPQCLVGSPGRAHHLYCLLPTSQGSVSGLENRTSPVRSRNGPDRLCPGYLSIRTAGFFFHNRRPRNSPWRTHATHRERETSACVVRCNGDRTDTCAVLGYDSVTGILETRCRSCVCFRVDQNRVTARIQRNHRLHSTKAREEKRRKGVRITTPPC